MASNSAKPEHSAQQAPVLHARYVLSYGFQGDMVIKNVTERGIGFQCAGEPIAVGEDISVDLPHLGVHAGVVRWVKDGCCGVEMAQPVDVERLKASGANLIPSPEALQSAALSQPAPRHLV